MIQMMSPENYIKQRARSLPVYECLVNTDWEDSKMANVIVTRKHTNSNVSLCIYLVDLFCLGVKDTLWHFNMPLHEYSNMISEIEEQMELKPISYCLAHNIIFAAVDFAEEYGFQPHRDFTSITCFMLEEDTEDIELIDIECGMEGKPAYMRSPGHSKQESERIIATLERNAGPGNYFFFDEPEKNESIYGEASYNDDPDDNDP